MSTTRKTHGGARPGSGRKAKYPEGLTERITANVPTPLVNKLTKLAKKRKCSRAEIIVELIRQKVG